MSDPLRRATRTLAQVGFAEAIVQFVEAFFVDFTEPQHAALLVLIPFVVGFVQNLLEDAGTIPALLKAPASEGANPVPDPD